MLNWTIEAVRALRDLTAATLGLRQKAAATVPTTVAGVRALSPVQSPAAPPGAPGGPPLPRTVSSGGYSVPVNQPFATPAGLSPTSPLAQKLAAMHAAAQPPPTPAQQQAQRGAAARTEVLDALRQEADQLDRSRAKAKALEDVYHSPAGAKAVQEQLKARKALAAEEEKAGRARRKAEVGGFAEGLEHVQSRLAEMGSTLDTVSSKAGMAFGAGAAALSGFIAAASPAHWDSLTGSISLLSMAIGKEFLPYAEDMIGWLQKATSYIEGMDSATKGTIAKVLVFATALTAVVLAGTVLLKVLTFVGAAILGLVGKIESFLVASFRLSTVTANLLALGVVVGGLAAAFLLLSGNANKAGQEVEGVSKKKPGGTGVDISDLQKLSDEDRERLIKAGKNIEDRLRVLREQLLKATEEEKRAGEEAVGAGGEEAAGQRKLRKAQVLAEYDRGEEGGKDKGKAIQDLAEIYKGLPGAADYIRAVGGALKMLPDANFKGGLEQLIAELEKKMGGGKLAEAQARRQQLEEMLKAGGGAGGLQLSTGRVMPEPGMYTGAGFGEHMQMQALQMMKEGDIEATRFRQQLEALNKLITGNDKLIEHIDDATDAIKKITPPWRIG